MRKLYYLLSVLAFVFNAPVPAPAIDLPPCPEDIKCNYPPPPAQMELSNNPFYANPNQVGAHLSQYDCSNQQNKNCFFTLPKSLDQQTKTVIKSHAYILGYADAYLNSLTDDHLIAINEEYNRFDQYVKQNLPNPTEQYHFQLFYQGIHSQMTDGDTSTSQFEPIKQRVLAKQQKAQKLAQLTQLPADVFYVVPEPELLQMTQQSLQSQPFPRLFFLNIPDQHKRQAFQQLLTDALAHVDRALAKIQAGHPCQFLPCSNPFYKEKIIQMIQSVLHHPKFYIFERSNPKQALAGLATINYQQKGLIGFTQTFYTMHYDYEIHTLIHESMHLYGAVDLVYFEQASMELLRQDPQKAMTNADNYALEIMSLGRIQCFSNTWEFFH